MDVKCEASGLKIGVDNSLTEALIDGHWGLIDKIQASMKAIQEVKKQQEEYRNVNR